MGACRANEMYSMKLEHLQDLGSAFLITVPNTKTKITRKFTITDKFYQICKKYINLRPTNFVSDIFFLNYQNGKCTKQRIGINKFTVMGKQIATFLKLPNPETYSGHSFRRSSATLLIDAGGDITALKRHGGWKSTSVAEGYIDESLKNKMDTAHKITNSIDENASTSYFSSQVNVNPSANSQAHEYAQSTSTSNQNINLDVNSLPSIQLAHCSNVNITFNISK